MTRVTSQSNFHRLWLISNQHIIISLKYLQKSLHFIAFIQWKMFQAVDLNFYLSFQMAFLYNDTSPGQKFISPLLNLPTRTKLNTGVKHWRFCFVALVHYKEMEFLTLIICDGSDIESALTCYAFNILSSSRKKKIFFGSYRTGASFAIVSTSFNIFHIEMYILKSHNGRTFHILILYFFYKANRTRYKTNSRSTPSDIVFVTSLRGI